MYKLIQGDCIYALQLLKEESVQCVVTSPPYYGLRDYGVDGQIGLEQSPEEYVAKLVNVFLEVRRVLRDDGTLWLNLGDSYAGSGGPGSQYDNKSSNSFKGEFKKYDNPNRVVTGLKPKDLIGIPWRVAFALQADGWYLRSDIIWHKPNPMPESVTDRPTKSHEYIFLLTKSPKYYYDYQAILEPAKFDGRKDTQFKGSDKYKDSGQTFAADGHERWPLKIGRTEKKMEGTGYGGDGKGLHGHSGYFDGDGNPRFHQFEDGVPARNRRTVWTIPTQPYADAHFATYPPALVEPCIKAGSKPGDTVLDPFCGSGTTGEVAERYERDFIGIELNPEYVELARKRIDAVVLPMFSMAGDTANGKE